MPTTVIHPAGLTKTGSVVVAIRLRKRDARALRRQAKRDRCSPGALIRAALITAQVFAPSDR